MQRKDFSAIGILYLAMLLIFYPVFYTDYIFTDEAPEIWGFHPGTGFVMFLDDGRALTEWLQYPLFNAADTIHGITFIRIISLLGWMVCVPVWYAVLKRLCSNRPEYASLPFFTCFYMITSLPFLVSVQWATCMQFFLAQTSALVAGGVLCITLNEKSKVTVPAALTAIVLGVVSMLFYQSAAGCFLIPFLLHFLNDKNAKRNKVLITGGIVYLLVYVVYFGVYKWLMSAYHVPHHPRNDISIDVVDKVIWFFARPLERSFRFSFIVDEESKVSKYYFLLALVAWAALSFKRFGGKPMQAIWTLAVCTGLFFLSYIPNLIVKENYASNRTMFALNLLVWLVWADLLLYYVKNKVVLQGVAGIVALSFLIAARNNFTRGFMHPAAQETAALKGYVNQHYNSGIKSIYFIRPRETFTSEKYKIHQSMDEFGTPVTFADWVPESLCKQLVYEKTHDRKGAGQLAIRQWPNAASFQQAALPLDTTVLLIDVESIMANVKP